MATKGPSNRYGNSRGGRNGHPTEHTGFAWTKDFLSSAFTKHFNKHRKQFSSQNKTSYAAKAVKFANTIDKKNNVSYVRKNGDTVKFSKKTGEFAIINKNGYIITYFKPKTGIQYYLKDRRKNK